MKTCRFLPLMTVLCLAPAFASAECYASYKAKRDDPLQLHFGVAEVGDGNCSKEAAGKVLAGRLARDGWILLSIVEMIPADRLGEVKDRAGDYFLRY